MFARKNILKDEQLKNVSGGMDDPITLDDNGEIYVRNPYENYGTGYEKEVSGWTIDKNSVNF